MTTEQLVIACTLNHDLLRERVREWHDVVAAAEGLERIPGGARLRYMRGGAEDAARVAALAQAERDCCPFFSFTLRIADAGTSLDVTAPEGAVELVDVLLGAGTATRLEG